MFAVEGRIGTRTDVTDCSGALDCQRGEGYLESREETSNVGDCGAGL